MKCKALFSILIFFAFVGSKGQSLPNITYQDYGFNKQVSQVEQIFYSIDGDSIEKVEKVIHRFNPEGNISSYENQSFLDESWAKSKAVYKNNRLHQEIWEHSNPYLNRKYTYRYDKQGKITEEKIRFKDGSKSYIKFHYKNNLLNEIEADIDGTKSITERHYSQKENLYKEIHRQKVPGEADIITNYFYLEDREIISYVEPQSYFYATVYLKDAMGNEFSEIKFRLIEDSTVQSKLIKGIQRFEEEAPTDNLPFGLKQYAEQTLQAYNKNKDELIPFNMKLFLRDKYNNIITEAEVDVKTKTIVGIGFFKIEYADGSTTGTTNFLHKKLHIFEALLQQYLP